MIWILLCLPTSEVGGEGLSKQVVQWVGLCGPGQAAPSSLYGTCPLCLPLSFLTDKDGHIGWDVLGGGEICAG